MRRVKKPSQNRGFGYLFLVALSVIVAAAALARLGSRPGVLSGDNHQGDSPPGEPTSSLQSNHNLQPAIPFARDAKGTIDHLQSRYERAFTLARQGRQRQALEDFALLRKEASNAQQRTSVTPANLEPRIYKPQLPIDYQREAAYQHAVLTAALAKQSGGPKSRVPSQAGSGDSGLETTDLPTKQAAIHEYLQIIKDYPESEQAAKAVRRLAAMHNGQFLPAEQKVWEAAQKTAQDREHARMRANSLCGPECVAELLRRRAAVPGSKSQVQERGLPDGAKPASGEESLSSGSRSRDARSSHQVSTSAGAPRQLLDLGPGTLDSLAREMKADEFGTTLQSVQQALQRRGFHAKGLKLSLPALWNKPLPAVALLKQGHFVLVDRIAGGTVETWDPTLDVNGTDGPKSYTWPQFEKAWTGMALVLD